MLFIHVSYLTYGITYAANGRVKKLFFNIYPLQKRQNITMLVNSLYIDFDGTLQNIQEYEVQCDAQRKVAMINIISVEERNRLNELARLAKESSTKNEDDESEPHETSDIIFISICVLAVILMLIAVVWLVLL